jgi:hypothetical protein
MSETPTQRLWKLQARPLLFGGHRRDSEVVDIFHELAAACDRATIFTMAPYFLTDAVADVRKAAVEALHTILSTLQTFQILELSGHFEASSRADYWGTSEKWRNLQPSRLSEIASGEKTRVSVLGYASFHRNGFVRHEAARQLATIHDGTELPFLLIRQNDWVAPISADARDAVRERLTPEYLPHFVANLALVLHLLTFQRHDHSQIVQRIVELLLKPNADAIFANAVRSPIRRVRREIMRIALACESEHTLRVVQHGISSNDSAIRLWSARQLASCLAGDTLREALSTLKCDPFMPVRRAAMLIEADKFPEAAIAVWKAGLLDSNTSLRELSQIAFKKLSRSSEKTMQPCRVLPQICVRVHRV